MVGSVEPRPIVWENIKAAIGHAAEQQAPLVLPEAPPAPPPKRRPGPAGGSRARPAPVVAERRRSPGRAQSNVIQLSGRARRWRNVASFATAIAAALIAMLAVQVYQPELLPNALRPKPRIQTVEVKTPRHRRRRPRNTSPCCSATAARPRSS